MLANRISFGLAAFLLVVSAGMTARGQDHELQGAALFEPADVRPYDNWAEPKQGLFFTFDGLYWHISPCDKTTIGDPNRSPIVYLPPVAGDTSIPSFVEQNTLDTSAPSIWNWGDRMELGYIDGHHGFMFSSLLTESQTANLSASNAFVVFYPGFFNGTTYLNTPIVNPVTGLTVPLETPVNFQAIYVQNKSRVDGAEALYIYRASECYFGGTLEFMLGGRYLELKDQFWVDARGGNLTDSYWNTESHNEIAGPEIGMRYFQPFGRFGISADTRFTPGINSQAIAQDGRLAAGLIAGQNAALPLTEGATAYPTLMGATGFNSSTHFIEFSPIVELRVEAHMQLTNLIEVKAGYTGIFVNNVVRAADMVNYSLPNMGITRSLGGNLQEVYIQGLNLSIEFNR